MNTNKSESKTNQRPKQQDLAAPKLVLAAVSPEAQKAQPTGQASRSAQPLTATEFGEELERQRQQKLRKITELSKADFQAEALVDTILAGGTAANGARAHRTIKLGIDVHLDRYVVVRQIDGGAPQPPQRFSPEQFVAWAKKQAALAEKGYSCYEAGPFGYSLHRKLTALGITNYVVRPRDWDEYGKKVKTDKRDAKGLVLNLDRYLGGNRDAFCVVRVPSEAEEQSRSRSRQREQLQKEKQRLAAQGRSDALYYGGRLEGEWWTPARWKELVLPPIVLELLAPLSRLIQELVICDLDRFKNRRQVASYTGMCPREDSSAQRRFQGSINKHGNGRVRSVLVEASWRLIQFQPTYKPVAKWLPVLVNPKTTKSKRKQIAVAIGRQFSVDWWRVRTKRVQPQALGLKLKPAPVVAPTPPAKPTQASKTKKS